MQKNLNFFFLLLVSLACNCNTLTSQTNISSIEDSILKIISREKQDTIIAGYYNDLGLELRRNNPTQAIKYGNKALLIYTQSNILTGMAKSYLIIGTAYMNLSKHIEAIDCFNKSISLGEKAGDKKVIARAYNNMGIVFIKQGNTSEAIKNYLFGLKLREELNDKGEMGISYANIGNVYFKEKNYKEALRNYELAEKLFKNTTNKFGLANAIANKGNVLEILGNIDTALHFYYISLKINIEINDKRGISSSYNRIGGIYAQKKMFKLAKEYYSSALQIDIETENADGMGEIIKNIAVVDMELNNYAEAEKNLIQNIKTQKNTRNLSNIMESYFLLSVIDTLKKDYKMSFYHYKEYANYKDSILNKENTEKIVQQQLTFEFNKKVEETKQEQLKKDIIAKEELRQQKIVTYISGGAGILVFLFLIIALKAYKGKQKANLIITHQKIEVEKQKHLVDEKQKEIIDSITYAKRLQEAILPPPEFLDKHIPNNFILYKPKDLVAGDFYWAEKINDLFFIAAADSTGHGVPGALVSVVCSNALNRTVKEFCFTETGKILDKTRELVFETFEKSSSDVKDGMDISLLCIDTMNKKIFWSGANNPLWYIYNSELIIIKADKQPIGKTEYPKPFTTHQIEYKQDTAFYLFTDGFADQFGGPLSKKFNYKQFSDVLIVNNKLTQNEQKGILDKVFVDWKGDLDQVDDVCIIGIRI